MSQQRKDGRTVRAMPKTKGPALSKESFNVQLFKQDLVPFLKLAAERGLKPTQMLRQAVHETLELKAAKGYAERAEAASAHTDLRAAVRDEVAPLMELLQTLAGNGIGAGITTAGSAKHYGVRSGTNGEADSAVAASGDGMEQDARSQNGLTQIELLQQVESQLRFQSGIAISTLSLSWLSFAFFMRCFVMEYFYARIDDKDAAKAIAGKDIDIVMLYPKSTIERLQWINGVPANPGDGFKTFSALLRAFKQIGLKIQTEQENEES